MALAALLKNRTTPGVYITEFPAFGNSIVGVATAVPIFVGYTQYAADPASGKQLYNQAVPLTCMADYQSYFGGGFDTQYAVGLATANGPAPPSAASGSASPPAPPAIADYDFQAMAWDASTGALKPKNFVVQADDRGDVITPRFNLYMAMNLFFANGGSNCLVVSVSDYWDSQSTGPQSAAQTAAQTPTSVGKQKLLDGLAVAQNTRGPTMIVVPDACLLTAQQDGVYADYSGVIQAMINQAGTQQDRVAIIDLPGALDPTSWKSINNAAFQKQVDAMSAAVAAEQQIASYGAAYGPAVESSILTLDDVDFTNLQATQASQDWMNHLLTTQAQALYTDPDKLSFVQTAIGKAFATSADCPFKPISPPPTAPATLSAADTDTLSKNLRNALPLLQQIEQILVSKLNIAPPSGIMAGIWAASDASRGVWNAPANMTVASAIAPKVLITDLQQGQYNIPLDGYSVTILRAMPNRGVVVWGARTLDGNSNDYRYIQVRRTLIYVEQSIKAALQPFVFAANDGQTWVTVTSMIANFLTNLWKAGGLMGDKASEAFTVNCGLGSTMTGQDILNGYMIVSVSLQMIHPAEFIELTFTQMMQGT
jgi:phage tail sheath protein FI